MKTVIRALVALGVAALLVGCYGSSNVSSHQSGAYKGSSDPFLKGDASTRDAKLADRFSLVQRDR